MVGLPDAGIPIMVRVTKADTLIMVRVTRADTLFMVSVHRVGTLKVEVPIFSYNGESTLSRYSSYGVRT